MNTTYAESMGELTFNWFKELSKPHISDERWKGLKELSKSWITCACGNQCDIIPRDAYGRPKDDILFCLGGEFYLAICHKDVDEAIQYLHKIEERSAVLILEINKNRKP